MISNITNFFHSNIQPKKISKNKAISFGSKADSYEKTVTVKGKETSAKIFTPNIDYATLSQIQLFCNHPVFRDIPIRIMPDTHAGVNSVVGFSAPVNNTSEVIPNIIGGDIGCGMLCIELDTMGDEIDYQKLDSVIRSTVSSKRKILPEGYEKLDGKFRDDVHDLLKHKYKTKKEDDTLASLGTLGGGNHFIELDKSDGKYYLVIHSGSRQFGKDVANYHSSIAEKQNPYSIKGLSYLSGAEAKDYLQDMKLAVEFSKKNRRIIADEIIKQMGWREISSFESIHNYIAEDGIIRKGAIKADKDETMIIPLNKRDGALIAKGKGNPDWNNTAPHGAGRQYKRSEAKEHIDYDEYVESMKGIYTTCVSPATIDESPQAYKDAGEIIDNIEGTADVADIISPIYNYKD